jgi:hypothetical protein
MTEAAPICISRAAMEAFEKEDPAGARLIVAFGRVKIIEENGVQRERKFTA